jgi:SprT protein
MMIDPIVVKRIEDKILEVLLQAQSIYKQPFTLPTLEYRQMGRKAGYATYSTWHVALNSDFLHNGHLEEMIEQTLPHEIAHLISYKVYGPVLGTGHGRCWKSVMSRLGLEVRRCHDYSLEGVKVRKVTRVPAKCPCCGQMFNLTKIKANRIQMGRKIWHSEGRCGLMKQSLVLVPN